MKIGEAEDPLVDKQTYERVATEFSQSGQETTARKTAACPQSLRR